MYKGYTRSQFGSSLARVKTSMKHSAKRTCATLQWCSLRDRTPQGGLRGFSRVRGWLGVWEGLRTGIWERSGLRVLILEEVIFRDTLVGV